MLGVGKLLEIRDQKEVLVAENLTVALNEEQLGKSTQKGIKQFIHKMLLMVFD
jgi:hypothetical protein